MSQFQRMCSARTKGSMLPTHDAIADASTSAAFLRGGNLLEQLEIMCAAALQDTSTRSVQRRLERLARWIAEQKSRGAIMSVAFPRRAGHSHHNAFPQLSSRFIYWPRGIPSGNWIGIVSSRLGKKLDQHSTWFDVFRTACLKLCQQNAVLLTCTGTVTCRFIRHTTHLFALPTLLLVEPREGASLEQWLDRLSRPKTDRPAWADFEGWLSPPHFKVAAIPREQTAPLRDETLFALADQLVVAHARQGGNVQRLLRMRLSSSRYAAETVRLAIGSQLVPRTVAKELLNLGAVGWIPRGEVRTPGDDYPTRLGMQLHPTAVKERKAAGDQLRAALAAEWPFLTHCTRAWWGPWPDQSDKEFIASLVEGHEVEPRTPFTSLERIVRQRRILGTGRGIRGGSHVVCFTALPLRELPRHRVFRGHRGRWDFEPYGICIRRDWLVRIGARPVRYGDDAMWQTMGADERPFFQRRTSRARRSKTIYDWSSEREWRTVGDVDLGLLPAEAGMLFVPCRAEATSLLEISPWPVAVLDPDGTFELT